MRKKINSIRKKLFNNIEIITTLTALLFTILISMLMISLNIKEMSGGETVINGEIVPLIIEDDVISIISMIATGIVMLLLLLLKNKFDFKMINRENAEIDKKTQFIWEYKKADSNVIELMLKNVSELREYYIISKNQATRTFSSALVACFLGGGIYIIGISVYVIFDKDISIVSIVGGTVVEVVAGLFFWLYREATKQLSIYHQRLGSTEKYLMIIQIIKEMPEDKRVDSYNSLIDAIISDNKEIISHEK